MPIIHITRFPSLISGKKEAFGLVIVPKSAQTSMSTKNGEFVHFTSVDPSPPPRFALTEVGIRKLRNEILDSLSSTRKRDNRFDLGLAALPHIEKEEAVVALRKRLDFLGQASIKIRQKYESQGGASLPLNVRALFLHPFSLIDNEQAFVIRLIHELLEEASRHGQIY